MRTLLQFIKDEEGASMAEYALLLALVVVGIATVINSFRTNMSTTITNTGNAFVAE